MVCYGETKPDNCLATTAACCYVRISHDKWTSYEVKQRDTTEQPATLFCYEQWTCCYYLIINSMLNYIDTYFSFQYEEHTYYIQIIYMFQVSIVYLESWECWDSIWILNIIFNMHFMNIFAASNCKIVRDAHKWTRNCSQFAHSRLLYTHTVFSFVKVLRTYEYT